MKLFKNKREIFPEKYVLIPKYYFPIMGGLQNSTYRFAECLAKMGKRVLILGLKPYNGSINLRDPIIHHENISIKILNCDRSNFWTYLKEELKNQEKPACCIAFGLEYPEYLDEQIATLVFAKKIGLSIGIKIATTGDFINRISKKQAFQLKKLNGIIVLNNRMYEEISSFKFLIKKTRIIPSMINSEFFKPLNYDERLKWRRFFQIPTDCFVLLWNGRITPRKRPLDIIHSWALANVSGILWIVGEDENNLRLNENALLKSIADKGLTNVVFNKSVPENIMPYIYGCSDAFISTSSVEGMSNSILEAATVGLPIVCYNIPGNIDIANLFDNKGFYLTEYPNIEKLTENINQVYINRIFNYRNERGKSLLQFDPHVIVNNYLDFILNNKS